MPAITEGIHNGEFVLSEGNSTISRENVVIAAAAGAMVSGQLLGKITASGKYVAYTPGAVDGTQTCAGILYTAVPDSAADQRATMVARLAEVKAARITGTLDATSKAALAALLIFAR